MAVDDKRCIIGNSGFPGSLMTDGADYAEFFQNEETLKNGDIAGLNLATGKVRKYRAGDEFIGIATPEAGFVANAKHSDDRSYSLIGLMGQLEFRDDQVVIENRIVKTPDGTKIGVLLKSGKVFIR
jgi:hypothetical protein